MVEKTKQEFLQDYSEIDILDYDEMNLPDNNENGGEQKPTTFAGVASTSFNDMMLKQELLKSITDCGFEHPSDVQQRCIPNSILGSDILCQAVSGMGKTAVFVLSILHNLADDPKPCSALILCHTRELAYQIRNELARFSCYMKHVRSSVMYGGEPYDKHVQELKGDKPPHIIVGTPGRILALARDKILPLDNLKMFVLDECDKLLDQVPMRSDIQKIFRETPHNKQVMMFTATLSEQIKETCRKFMRNPTEVLIENDSKLTLHGLKQYYVKLDSAEKISKLINLIDQLAFNQVIIFVKSRRYAIKLAEILNKDMIPSKAVHRDLSMDERIKIYEGFKQFKHRILVATELFGRGIDIEKINIVFNFDMPADSDSYLHRVGRAGRFGTKGLAITFVDKESENGKEQQVLDEIQARFDVKIPELPTTIESATYMNN